MVRTLAGTATLLCLAVVGAWRMGGDDAGAGAARVPVLLELFTSEGCSSCPPADALLARLAGEQPVGGVTVVALGFHVDYWDGLGWKDPFSAKAFTDRQQAYAQAWNSDRIYTPQAVVNGRTEFIGSSWPAAQRLLGEAARTPLAPLGISVSAPDGEGRVRVEVDARTLAVPSANSDVLLAVAEDGLTTSVRRGENANRRLSHVAVVRSLTRLGTLEPGRVTPAPFARELRLDPGWTRTALRFVAFVQEEDTRRIRALGSATLPD